MSFRRFLYEQVRAAGCELTDGLPELKCRTQDCERCELKQLLPFKKITSALNLPFSVPATSPTRTYLTSPIARDVTPSPNADDAPLPVTRPKPKSRIFTYKHTTVEHVAFSEAWERMFVKHPGRKQPFAQIFIDHRGQVDWFDGEFGRLINREDPALPIGTLVVMVDFSESFHYQFAHKTSGQIYDKQPVMLGPTLLPCTYSDTAQLYSPLRPVAITPSRSSFL